MTRNRYFVASFSLLATLALGACGGDVNPPGLSLDGGRTGSSGGAGGSGNGGSGATSGGSGGTNSTGGGGTGGGGRTCVDIELSTYDVSCDRVSDCTMITPGEICDGDCACGGATVNVSAQARYQSAISSLQLGACSCPLEGAPECIDHVCTLCTGLASDPPACQTQAVDAGAACVDIDLSTYDTSCQQDADCASITAGTICAGSCMCGGAAINTDGIGRYDTAVRTLGTSGACNCPFVGVASCVANKCTICGFGPDQVAGCPDGG